MYEKLKKKTEESIRLTYTVLLGELEHSDFTLFYSVENKRTILFRILWVMILFKLLTWVILLFNLLNKRMIIDTVFKMFPDLRGLVFVDDGNMI